MVSSPRMALSYAWLLDGPVDILQKLVIDLPSSNLCILWCPHLPSLATHQQFSMAKMFLLPVSQPNSSMNRHSSAIPQPIFFHDKMFTTTRSNQLSMMYPYKVAWPNWCAPTRYQNLTYAWWCHKASKSWCVPEHARWASTYFMPLVPPPFLARMWQIWPEQRLFTLSCILMAESGTLCFLMSVSNIIWSSPIFTKDLQV